MTEHISSQNNPMCFKSCIRALSLGLWGVTIVLPLLFFGVCGLKLFHLSFEDFLSSLGDLSFIYFIFFGWTPLLGLLSFWLLEKGGGTTREILKTIRVSYFLMSVLMASPYFFFFYPNYPQSCGPYLLKALDSIKHHMLVPPEERQVP